MISLRPAKIICGVTQGRYARWGRLALAVLVLSLMLAGCGGASVTEVEGKKDTSSDAYFKQRHLRVVNDFLDSQGPTNDELRDRYARAYAARYKVWSERKETWSAAKAAHDQKKADKLERYKRSFAKKVVSRQKIGGTD